MTHNEIEQYLSDKELNTFEYQLAMDAMLFAEQKTIENGKKWLENFLEKTIQKPSINDGYTSDTIESAELKRHRLIEEVLCDFKKEMEE
jgi:hypothetical protein